MFCVKRGGDSNDRVIIFFTGHGLFFPTTVEEFRKQVVERDKFELDEPVNKSRHI